MIVIVDLDKTLLSVDTTMLALSRVVQNQPRTDIIKSLLKGKKFFKSYLLNHVDWDKIEYPVNMAVLDYINKMKKNGDSIYLVSGSNQQIVDAVSRKIKVFDVSIGTSKCRPNLKYRKKLSYINQILSTNEWVYIADAFRDVAIWKNARIPILVTNSRFKYLLISKLKIKNLQLIKVCSIAIFC